MRGEDPKHGSDEEIVISDDEQAPPAVRRRTTAKRRDEPDDVESWDLSKVSNVLRKPVEDDLKILAMIPKGVDITEVFSPPRGGRRMIENGAQCRQLHGPDHRLGLHLRG